MKINQNPKAQAEHFKREMLKAGRIKSFNVANSRRDVWTMIARFCDENNLGNLKTISLETLVLFLENRAEEVGQSALTIARSAAQMLVEEKLPRIESEFEITLKSRAFFDEEIAMIAGAQNTRNSLATRIVGHAGLRSIELHTLRPLSEQATSSHRAFFRNLFVGRFGVPYSVVGKGKLCRPVNLTRELSEELELYRLPTPVKVYNREIQYVSLYDLAGGTAWASSVSMACDRLGIRSTGAHGIRHTFAQKRLGELLALGFTYAQALLYVSQAMGHFRRSITQVYLR